jgi:hypothetical protein
MSNKNPKSTGIGKRRNCQSLFVWDIAEALTDVYDVAISIDHDVSVVPVLDL